jgi:CrcB protein
MTTKPVFDFLLVALGGAAGAMLRYAIARGIDGLTKYTLPLGTLVANALGCLIIGLLIGSGQDMKSETLRLWLGVGFLGGLTTFSTFAADTINEINQNHWALAIGNVASNLFICLLVVVVGIALSKRFLV